MEAQMATPLENRNAGRQPAVGSGSGSELYAGIQATVSFGPLDVGPLLRLVESIELLVARDTCSQAEVTTLRNWFSDFVDRRDILLLCAETVGLSSNRRVELEHEFRLLARVVAAINKRRAA
jgi:hypothetical protein